MTSLKAEDSTFSDLKLRLLPKIQERGNMQSTSQPNLEKYDSLLQKATGLPLRDKVEILQKRSFEKFIRNMDKTEGEQSSRMIFAMPISNNLRPEIKTERKLKKIPKDFSVKRLRNDGKSIFHIETNTSKFNPSVLESRTAGEPKNRTNTQSLLLPSKSVKAHMASNLVQLSRIVEECDTVEGIPQSDLLKQLVDCFQEFIADDSYYSNTMVAFIRILRKCIFVCEESRLVGISDLLQLKNQEVNSFMFTEAGDSKLSHFECSQKILKAFLDWTTEASAKINDLEASVKSNPS